MAVTPLQPVESTPTSAEQLWALMALLTADWGQQISVSSAFETSIQSALSVAEQRWGHRGIPLRTIGFNATAAGAAGLRRLRALAYRAGTCRSLVPLACDQSRLTSAALAGATRLACPTADRRFAANSRAVVWSPALQSGGGGPDPLPITFDVVTIASLDASGLDLAAGTASAYPAGSLVCPLLECQLVLKSAGQLRTDALASYSVQGLEVAGATQLPSLAAVGSNPAGFATYDDGVHGAVPILSLSPDFGTSPDWSIERAGDLAASGLASVPVVYGARARGGLAMSFGFRDRATALSLVRFFESRGGCLLPFLVPAPWTSYQVTGVAVGGGRIVVAAAGAALDWNLVSHIALELTDGSLVIRRLTAASRSGGSDTLTFDAAVPALAAGGAGAVALLRRCTDALLVRSTSDELQETWRTDTRMEARLELLELLEEKTVSIADLSEPAATDLAAPWVAGDCSGDPAVLWVGTDTGEVWIWDKSSWTLRGSFSSQTVSAIARLGGRVACGGYFDGGYKRLAYWEGLWRAPVTAITAGPYGDGIETLAVHNGSLYVGGAFTAINGVSCPNVARITGTGFEATGGGPSPGVRTHALISFGGLVAATASAMKRWDGGTWQSMNTVGMTGYLWALCIYGGQLLAAGNGFLKTEPGPAYLTPLISTRIYAFNGTGWRVLATPPWGSSSIVMALASYAGGVVCALQGTGSGYANIGFWNGGAWSTMAGGLNGQVWDLAVAGSKLYAVGEFTASTAGVAMKGVACFDGVSWQPVGAGTELGGSHGRSVWAEPAAA